MIIYPKANTLTNRNRIIPRRTGSAVGSVESNTTAVITIVQRVSRVFSSLDQQLELWEKKYLIGSGIVESGAKQSKFRFGGARMRWSRPEIERLIPIRSAILSGQFDTLWLDAYHNLPPN